LGRSVTDDAREPAVGDGRRFQLISDARLKRRYVFLNCHAVAPLRLELHGRSISRNNGSESISSVICQIAEKFF